MKRGQIVADEYGNHFRIVKIDGDYADLESVATREMFRAPLAELHPTDRQTF